MTGKHFNWHKAWQRSGDRLIHESGLIVELDDDLGYNTNEASLEAWSAYEQNRGVPLHDLQNRLMRLLREAAEWDSRNPK